MTRLTDGNKTVEIEMCEWNWNGYDPDWSNDFFNTGLLPYDEETDTYTVCDVDYCVEQAKDEIDNMKNKNMYLFINGEMIYSYHPKYQLIIDTESDTHGIDFDDFNEAKS